MPEMIPFGKYKGQPIEVLESDPQYADWIAQQQWAKERYPQIVNIIINKFGESEETPDHNAMQAKFMDRRYCAMLAQLLGLFESYQSRGWIWENFVRFEETRELPGKPPKSPSEISQLVCEAIYFERNAVDVTFAVSHENWHTRGWAIIRAELKPTVGDDYPAVLRQMRNNRSDVLVYGYYTGSGVDEETFRRFFEMQKIRVAKESEILSRADQREKYLIEQLANVAT
jgi:hypothetical protein